MPLSRRVRDAAIIALGSLPAVSPQRRVVALHDTPDADRLRRKLAWLAAVHRVVDIDELTSAPSHDRTLVALTFDDGYRNWHEVAAPVLEDLRLPALFFVNSGFVGLSPRAARSFVRTRLRRLQDLSPLSLQQLRDLSRHPLFEIGGHTCNHLDLGGNLPRSLIAEEIGQDRRRLEDWTGRPVRWFAYPFGGPAHVSEPAREYLRQSGFQGAFTLVPGSYQPGRDPLAIGRDGVEISDSIQLWKAWLNGGYDALYRLKARFT